jgi:hypothetical protein
MLEGIENNEIIVGAYTDRNGGVCPMLAAHRHGGRTNLASFARAWDRYTYARRPRPASDRELRTLSAMIEASLWHDDTDLAAAAADHRATVEARTEKVERERRPTGERNRFEELRHRAGWAWMRVFRRYDDYAAALEQMEREEHAPERERELV